MTTGSAVQGGSNFWLLSPRMKSWSVTIQMKATEQYFPVMLFIVQYKVVLTFDFWVRGWNPKVWSFKWKLLSSTFLWFFPVVLAFESRDAILKREHSKESHEGVFFCGTVYDGIHGGFKKF